MPDNKDTGAREAGEAVPGRVRVDRRVRRHSTRLARSHLATQSAIKRVGPATAKRYREHDQAPHERVLVAGQGPAEFGRLLIDDDRHLDGDGHRKEAREEAQGDA
jgi:hypothetical protein